MKSAKEEMLERCERGNLMRNPGCTFLFQVRKESHITLPFLQETSTPYPVVLSTGFPTESSVKLLNYPGIWALSLGSLSEQM